MTAMCGERSKLGMTTVSGERPVFVQRSKLGMTTMFGERPVFVQKSSVHRDALRKRETYCQVLSGV